MIDVWDLNGILGWFFLMLRFFNNVGLIGSDEFFVFFKGDLRLKLLLFGFLGDLIFMIIVKWFDEGFVFLILFLSLFLFCLLDFFGWLILCLLLVLLWEFLFLVFLVFDVLRDWWYSCGFFFWMFNKLFECDDEVGRLWIDSL